MYRSLHDMIGAYPRWIRYALPGVLGGWITIFVVRKMWRRRRVRNAIYKRQEARRAAMTRNKEFLSQNPIDQKLMESILKLSIKDLQAKLQTGELRAVDVLRSYQIKAVKENETLNFITEPIAEAEELAVACDSNTGEKGILHGIPISLKENMRLKNKDSTVGVASLIGKLSKEDFILVTVLKSQGAIPFVRTNIPQTMLSFDCSNPIFGKTLNPHDVKRTPGGSSGGEGSILGSGASILGLGSDIAGSIRIPCHFCGVPGLKPTFGRLSTKGMLSLTRGQNIVIGTPGPMARDVDGLVLMMKALLSPLHFKLDPTIVDLPFQLQIYEDRSPLRVGYYTFDGYSEPVPACRRAVDDTVRLLEKAGHAVMHFEPPRIPYALSKLYSKALSGDGGKLILDFMKDDEVDPGMKRFIFTSGLPNFVRVLLSKFTAWISNDQIFGDMIRSMIGLSSVNEWWHLVNEVDAYRHEFCEAWNKLNLDVVICPGFGYPAPPYAHYDNIWGGGAQTPIYNLLNFAVGSLPITNVSMKDVEDMDNYPSDTLFRKGIKKAMVDSEGLPVTVQVVCLPWKEELTLRAMKEIEDLLRS